METKPTNSRRVKSEPTVLGRSVSDETNNQLKTEKSVLDHLEPFKRRMPWFRLSL